MNDASHSPYKDIDETKKQLLNLLNNFQVIIDEYNDINKNTLKRTSHEALNHKDTSNTETVERSIHRLQQLDLRHVEPTTRQEVHGVIQSLLHVNASPLHRLLSNSINQLAAIASSVNKLKPTISLEAENIYIKNRYRSLFHNVFIHLFRNTIDHGIESKTERDKKGKTSNGNIRIELTQYLSDSAEKRCSQHNALITYEDDGRGLNLKAIEAKARSKGLLNDSDIPNPYEIANLIFKDALSTSEILTDISGRGVGMSAIKNMLEEAGAYIQIQLKNPVQTVDFTHFSFNIILPAKMTATLEGTNHPTAQIHPPI